MGRVVELMAELNDPAFNEEIKAMLDQYDHVCDLLYKANQDVARYEKIKLMTFSQFQAIVSERMDGSGKTLDQLIDNWEPII
jgi:hypothetical protein